MPQSSPVQVSISPDSLAFAESIHAADFAMEERRDPFHKLLFVAAGRLRVHWTGEEPSAEGGRGSGWVIPAHTPHRIVDIEPATVLLLCLGTQFPVEKSLERLLERPAGPRQLGRDAENLWRRAKLEGTGRPRGWQSAQRALAVLLLVATDRVGESRSASSADRLRRFLRTLEETLYEDWSLDRAASATGLSRRQFSKLFRVETGKSFLEYLTELRLAYVEDLLLGGYSTVTGAVFSAGFDDLSHFYRLFRRRTGQSPGEWLHERRARPE